MVVKRKHITANIAPAIRTLQSQVTAAYPKRTVPDWIWPSPEHSKRSPKSDHEAGNAIDVRDDLGGGHKVTLNWLDPIRLDPRTNYVIHDRKIGDRNGWRNYTGSDPHTGHVHISILESKRNDTRPWSIRTPNKEAQSMTPVPRWFILAVFKTAAQAKAYAALCAANGIACPLSGRFALAHGGDEKSKIAEKLAESNGGTCPFGRFYTTEDSWRHVSQRTLLPDEVTTTDAKLLAAMKSIYDTSYAALNER